MFDMFRNYTRTEKRELVEKRERLRKELQSEWNGVTMKYNNPVFQRMHERMVQTEREIREMGDAREARTL